MAMVIAKTADRNVSFKAAKIIENVPIVVKVEVQSASIDEVVLED